MPDIDVSAAPERDHAEVLADHLALNGKAVLDVGCGAGRITRMMARLGADVIGIDPGARQLARAQAAGQVGGESYVQGTAEQLPSETGTIDIVVFFNSLHHVPINQLGRALMEARRVLRPSGRIYLAEPLAQGPQFELSKPFNDETEVRGKAYDAIMASSAQGFGHLHETVYRTDSHFKDFEAYRENSTSVKPARETYFGQNDITLRQRFEDLGEHRADGWHFPQYIRINILVPV